MVELRKYQEDAISAILGQWEQGYRHTLLVLPTGTGKTIVFAKITEIKVNGGKRILIPESECSLHLTRNVQDHRKHSRS